MSMPTAKLGDTSAAAPCREIAVYTVRPEALDVFPERQSEMHAALRMLPGFVSAERLRGIDTPTLFADCITWQSLAAAEEAAEQLSTLPGSGAFVASIAEMYAFTHVPVTTAGVDERAQ